MTKHFVIDMLPGREGDCIWIEYGDIKKPRRIIIDGGRQVAYKTLKKRFNGLPENQRKFELLVNTHVDADHIEGLIKLVEEPNQLISFKDVWFNGFIHLEKPTGTETFGAKQGERFGDGVIENGWPWNKAFDGSSVVINDDGSLPVINLAGGMKITLLSPTWKDLIRFRKKWKDECIKAGLIPGKSTPIVTSYDGIERFGSLNSKMVKKMAKSDFSKHKDKSRANGTSIAFIAEYGGKSALFSGDAFANVLQSNLKILGKNKPVKLDAFKLSHHGSRGALSNELLNQINCHTYLISTNGSRHNHPDREAISRVLVTVAGQKNLIGNYRSEEILEWTIPSLQHEFNYDVTLPNEEDGIMRVKLI